MSPFSNGVRDGRMGDLSRNGEASPRVLESECVEDSCLLSPRSSLWRRDSVGVFTSRSGLGMGQPADPGPGPAGKGGPRCNLIHNNG